MAVWYPLWNWRWHLSEADQELQTSCESHVGLVWRLARIREERAKLVATQGVSRGELSIVDIRYREAKLAATQNLTNVDTQRL